jgi:hypothetical protein
MSLFIIFIPLVFLIYSTDSHKVISRSHIFIHTKTCRMPVVQVCRNVSSFHSSLQKLTLTPSYLVLPPTLQLSCYFFFISLEETVIRPGDPNDYSTFRIFGNTVKDLRWRSNPLILSAISSQSNSSLLTVC